MSAKRILFINTETCPYVPENEVANMGKLLPETMQAEGCEIRTFMPKWGTINERRGQLHEVIRLSGMNIVIDDTDHPLIIKVASIPTSRVQIYFIDNEDFFTKRGIVNDAEGNEYSDNYERAIFFARGVLETVKKLRWTPDIIHCQGWMASIVPLYLRLAYQNEPCFENVKIVSGLFNSTIKGLSADNYKKCLEFQGVTEDALKEYKEQFDILELAKIAVDYSDAVIEGGSDVDSKILEYAKSTGKPFVEYPGNDFKEKYIELYNNL